MARVYGDGGANARDPRTGVVAAKLKDVLKGRLDGFLEGWRRRGERLTYSTVTDFARLRG